MYVVPETPEYNDGDLINSHPVNYTYYIGLLFFFYEIINVSLQLGP